MRGSGVRIPPGASYAGGSKCALCVTTGVRRTPGRCCLGRGRRARAVRRVDDPTVLDAELVEPALPLLELTPVGYAERDVIEAGPVLTELRVLVRRRMRVETEETATFQHVDHVIEIAGILIEYGIRIQEPAVRLPAPIEVADGYGHMRDAGERSHLRRLSIGYQPS